MREDQRQDRQGSEVIDGKFFPFYGAGMDCWLQEELSLFLSTATFSRESV